MAPRNYRIEDLHSLVKSGDLPLNSVVVFNNRKYSVLQLAIMMSTNEVIDYIIGKNVDLDQNIAGIGTALHLAVRTRNLDLVKKLISSGANVNVISNGHGRCSALDLAIIRRSYNIVEFLLKSGADINLMQNRAADESTISLALAIASGNPQIVELLLKYIAPIDKKSGGLNATVQFTILINRIEILEVLEKFGAELSVLKDGEYSKEFNAVMVQDNLEMFKFFVGNYKDIHSIMDDRRGERLIHRAVILSSRKILQYLLDCGADLNSVNNNNMTPFRLSVRLSAFQSTDIFTNHDKNIINPIVRHTIKLCTANLYVSDLCAELINMQSHLAAFRDECIEEIELMKNAKIFNSNLSFYNVLSKSIHKLAVGLKFVNDSFDDEELTRRFPLYRNMIFDRLKKGIERRDLLNRTDKLYDIFQHYLPNLFVREVFDYLHNDDLQLLKN